MTRPRASPLASRQQSHRLLTVVALTNHTNSAGRAPNIASVVSPTMDLCRARTRVFLHGARVARAQQDADQEESAAAESSPARKIFFQKRLPQKGYPLSGAETVFGQVFGRGGMSNFQNPRVPPTGGRIIRTHIQARLRCAEPCQFRPAAPATAPIVSSKSVSERPKRSIDHAMTISKFRRLASLSMELSPGRPFRPLAPEMPASL
jgi:hypothetical protein